MILGVGIDIVEVVRIEKLCQAYGDRFIKKILCQGEADHCRKRADIPASIAARFAAKEAFVKALGTGFTSGISFKDIEIKSEDGKPFISLHGVASEIAGKHCVSSIHLSLSHEKKHAVAVVILEGNNEMPLC